MKIKKFKLLVLTMISVGILLFSAAKPVASFNLDVRWEVPNAILNYLYLGDTFIVGNTTGTGQGTFVFDEVPTTYMYSLTPDFGYDLSGVDFDFDENNVLVISFIVDPIW